MSLGRQTNPDTAKICWTGAEANGAIKWWEFINDHFEVLLEAWG